MEIGLLIQVLGIANPPFRRLVVIQGLLGEIIATVMIPVPS
jgi:hypothetical protein